MPSPETPPALTPEEWASLEATDGFCLASRHTGRMVLALQDGGYVTIGRPEAVAALCLHGQPFGFTQADTAAIERAVETITVIDEERGTDPNYLTDAKELAVLRTLAARIRALLPP